MRVSADLTIPEASTSHWPPYTDRQRLDRLPTDGREPGHRNDVTTGQLYLDRNGHHLLQIGSLLRVDARGQGSKLADNPRLCSVSCVLPPAVNEQRLLTLASRSNGYVINVNGGIRVRGGAS